ncbi:hypothetical protein HC928_02065 [bacterium]|nr:hypothetical protein [bacterium]
MPRSDQQRHGGRPRALLRRCREEGVAAVVGDVDEEPSIAPLIFVYNNGHMV